MEYMEDTRYFDKEALPNAALLDAGENYANDEGNKSIAEGGDN